MPEWQLITESESFPEPPVEDEPRRSHPYRRWFFLGAALVILLVAGLVTIYRQWTDRRLAIREDLTAFIFEEETIHYFGDPNQTTTLVMPGAPAEWQWAYQQTFNTEGSGSPPSSIQLNQIDFDGQCAEVNVTLDGREQVRAYCLFNEQWRRAPVPDSAWDGKRTVIDLANGVQLSFRPRDRAFAEALVHDLPPIFRKLDRWAAKLDVPAVSQVSDRSLEISIEPHDLRAPLVSAKRYRLVLNSPLLVPLPGAGTMSGQDAVRLALARVLLRRTGLTIETTSSSLPGAQRLQTAVQTVVAMHLLLPTSAQEQLIGRWQTQLDRQWISPFFAGLLPPEAPIATQHAEVAACLTAEYIYRLAGFDSLLTFGQQIPVVNSWDYLFQTMLDRSTVAMESEVIAFAQGNESAVDTSPAPEAQPMVSNPPLQATLRRIEYEPDKTWAYVEIPSQPEPVIVEFSPYTSFRTSDGTVLPSGCVAPGTTLKIHGAWLERQRRLHTDRVTIQDIAPLTIEPAPRDTIAYLVEGAIPDEQDVSVERVFPKTRLYFVPGELFVPQRLAALRKNGTIQPLSPLSSTLQVVSLPIPAGGSPHFLFLLDLPDCDRTWLIHYKPMEGVVGQWLGPSPPMRWVWRANQQDLIFTNPRSGDIGHNIYGTNHTLSLQPIGQSPISVSFTGWNIPTEQLVFVKSWMGATSLGLIDPGMGSISRMKVYIHPLRARQLSPDGNWLAYLTGANNLFDPPYRLDLFSMEQMTETTLIRLAENEGIGPAAWSPYLAEPRLAVLTGPLVADDILRPTRLLIASPDQPETYMVVAHAAEGEQLAAPVFCSDGTLLYRVDHNGQFQLKRQKPGLPAQTLLTLDQQFEPLACP